MEKVGVVSGGRVAQGVGEGMTGNKRFPDRSHRACRSGTFTAAVRIEERFCMANDQIQRLTQMVKGAG